MGCSWTGTGGTAGSAKPPVLLSSASTVPRGCFCPARVKLTSLDSELLSSGVQRSTPRQFCGNRAVIYWFRLLSDCLGRTGRHRGSDGNRSPPIRILCCRHDAGLLGSACRKLGLVVSRGLTPKRRRVSTPSTTWDCASSTYNWPLDILHLPEGRGIPGTGNPACYRRGFSLTPRASSVRVSHSARGGLWHCQGCSHPAVSHRVPVSEGRSLPRVYATSDVRSRVDRVR